jgi:translocator protein
MKEKTQNTILNIIIALFGVGIIVFLATLFTNTTSDWYLNLVKPSYYPPKIVFPIIWTIIYVCAFITMFLLLQNNKMSQELGLIFGINGILNAFWCLSFFTLQNQVLGLIAIILNLIASIVLIIYLFKDYKVGGYLLLIYPIWVMIATILNIAIVSLN